MVVLINFIIIVKLSYRNLALDFNSTLLTLTDSQLSTKVVLLIHYLRKLYSRFWYLILTFPTPLHFFDRFTPCNLWSGRPNVVIPPIPLGIHSDDVLSLTESLLVKNSSSVFTSSYWVSSPFPFPSKSVLITTQGLLSSLLKVRS